MLQDLAISVPSPGTESIWLPRALQSARTLGRRREERGREGRGGREGEGDGAREGKAGRGKETGARAEGETHLQSLSALPAGGAGPPLRTFFSTRTLRSCSVT